MAPTDAVFEALCRLGSDRSAWRTVRFGDVVRNVNTVEADPQSAGLERFVGLDHLDPESLHIKRWGLIADGTTFTRRFQPGHVLFGKRRAYQKKAAVAEWDGICSGDILVFEPKNGDLLAELLPFIVQSDGFFAHALGTSAGSLSPRTRWSDLADYRLALPPLDEQHRIAEMLWAVEDAFIEYQSVFAQCNLLKDLIAGNVFTLELAKKNDWYVGPLDQFVEVRTGLAKGKDLGSAAAKKLPYLRVANVQDGFLDLKEIKTIEVIADEIDRYSLREDDVLLTEGGDFDKLGRGAIWSGQINPCLHQNHIFVLRPKRKEILPRFLLFQTGSSYGKKYFLSCAKKTSNLASINSKQVKAFPLILPSKEFQEQFVIAIETAATASGRAAEHITQLKFLKKLILQEILDYLSGSSNVF